LAAVSLIGQANDLGPFSGTWKINLAKSKYDPGPGPKTATIRYEPSANGFVFTLDGVGTNGQPTHVVAKAAFDGKEYPLEGAAQKTLRVYRRIDTHTFEETDSVAGKVTLTRRVTVSKDGKTLTVTSKGTNAQGQRQNNVIVYEK
jgi:hypothetical protein